MKRILFYSSVKDKSLFHIQQFYSIDIEILKNLGYEVFLTNNYIDFLILKYDIAFIYFYTRGVVPALISRVRMKKVFFTGGIDSLDEKHENKRRHRMQTILFKICRFLSTKCIIVSESDLHNIKKIFKNELPSKLKLVFHGIKTNEFSCNFNNKRNDFVSICWMHGVENVKRKGVDLSLHYFKYLSSFDEFKDSKYYIIGTEGEGSDYLKKIVCELDLPDRVVFTGSIDEHSKREYLKKSKYYFQLSLYEGFGVGALEALAASCIVIHSGKGGLKEIIKDDGILLNTSGIDLDIINKIKSFNINKLESALNRVKETYDFTIRMREIGILLSES